MNRSPHRLAEVAPDLAQILDGESHVSPRYSRSDICRETMFVTMRDGNRLATDLYLPPDLPAPAIAVRTPYGRDQFVDAISLAQRGYVVVVQDVRGTGESEPDSWDTFIYEGEDGIDFVQWVTEQPWFDGFLGACGGSYLGSTQWGMSMHPRMSAIAPEVAGIGVSRSDTPNFHLFVNAFSRSVGKGEDKVTLSYSEMEQRMLQETLEGGYYNAPLNLPLPGAVFARYPGLHDLSPAERKRWLWDCFRTAKPAERVELIKLVTGETSITLGSELAAVFGHHVPYGLFTFPNTGSTALIQSLNAPSLIITGWYDWGNGDTLATWDMLTREGVEPARSDSRLLITPNAHNRPGYREGIESHPELGRIYRITSTEETHRATMRDLLLHWYDTVRGKRLHTWPTVTYYLMGACEWHTASAWPPPQAEVHKLFLGSGGALTPQSPLEPSDPDSYLYDPRNPTPTLGGSILSCVYTPGSVDVSEAQRRDDVLTFTSPVLSHDLDVVGPLRLILFASSSAVDTDFTARLSDVFPDGRAIQLQSSTLRARYRNAHGEAELLEPDRAYQFEIDMWATANRFKAGHRLRLDISSADFPKFDRNANLGGGTGDPISAKQHIYHDPDHPTHLLVSILGTTKGLWPMAAMGDKDSAE